LVDLSDDWVAARSINDVDKDDDDHKIDATNDECVEASVITV